MNIIIKDSLQSSMSYSAYRKMVKQLVAEKSNTGNEKNDDLANYTLLNDKRMNRWDKTFKLSDEVLNRLAQFKDNISWLVIIESWCGDAAHIVPVLNKIAEAINIDFRVVLRDENLELIDMFLSNGARSIPKLIMIDNQTGDVIDTYGPRPNKATKMVQEVKAKHGVITPEFKQDLQVWYNKDKGQNIIKDITEMLCQREPSICQQN